MKPRNYHILIYTKSVVTEQRTVFYGVVDTKSGKRCIASWESPRVRHTLLDALRDASLHVNRILEMQA